MIEPLVLVTGNDQMGRVGQEFEIARRCRLDQAEALGGGGAVFAASRKREGDQQNGEFNCTLQKSGRWR